MSEAAERTDPMAVAAGLVTVTLWGSSFAGTAAMLINTGPILIAILAGIFLKEGFPRWLLAGCAVAFSGCVLIGLANTQASSRAGSGIALLLVAALAYASAVVIQSRS